MTHFGLSTPGTGKGIDFVLFVVFYCSGVMYIAIKKTTNRIKK